MRKTVLSFVALCALAVHAYDTWTDSAGYTWTYDAYHGDGAEIRGVSPSTGSVTIPSILGDKPVTSIGLQAFFRCRGLTSVTIPDSVTSIGVQAFYECSGLTSVTIGNGVTSIGDGAFYGCSSLTSVTIPDSVTSIEAHAFYGCSSLTSVTIPDSVMSVGVQAFEDCSASLYDVNSIPGVKLVNGWAVGNTGTLTGDLNLTGVRGIAPSAFGDCSGLTSVTIPDNVTSIGECAFYGCSSLTSVTIPDSVTSIGWGAFEDCSASLYDVNSISGVMLVDGWAVGNTGTLSGDLNLTGVRGIASHAF